MTQAYTRPGPTDVDYNAVSGDSVTSAAQKLDNAIDDIYTQIQDGSTLVKGVLQLGTGATQAAAGNHLHTGTYAPAAEGVTNGNTHDHNGGDGGTIAFASLSGTADVLKTGDIGVSVQAYDADTMKSDVVTARTRAHRFAPVQVTAAAGGALAIDCDLHEECYITLAETTTTVGQASNQARGKYVVIEVTGTTGKALAWNTNWQKDGANCTIAAPANGVVDIHCFRSSGTEMIHIGSKLAV